MNKYIEIFWGRNIYVRSKFSCVRSSHNLCVRAQPRGNIGSRLLQEQAITGVEISHITSYRELRVKDLPKVPTERLEWDWNQRPSAPKATNTTTKPTTPHVWELWLFVREFVIVAVLKPKLQSRFISEFSRFSRITNLAAEKWKKNVKNKFFIKK